MMMGQQTYFSMGAYLSVVGALLMFSCRAGELTFYSYSDIHYGADHDGSKLHTSDFEQVTITSKK